MRTASRIVALACLLPAAAWADFILDQEHAPTPPWLPNAVYFVGPSRVRAQSFTAGRDGALAAVEALLFFGNHPAIPVDRTLSVEIWSTTDAGLPSASLTRLKYVPSFDIPAGWVRFDVTALNLQMSTGVQYALVLRPVDFGTGWLGTSGPPHASYPGGVPARMTWEQEWPTSEWRPMSPDVDLCFRTYLVPEVPTLVALLGIGVFTLRHRR